MRDKRLQPTLNGLKLVLGYFSPKFCCKFACCVQSKKLQGAIKVCLKHCISAFLEGHCRDSFDILPFLGQAISMHFALQWLLLGDEKSKAKEAAWAEKALNRKGVRVHGRSALINGLMTQRLDQDADVLLET